MNLKKILFIDKSEQYCQYIKEVLGGNYNVDTTINPFKAMDMMKDKQYDLVISEVNLKGISGFQLFSLVRKMDFKIKLMILTNSKNEIDELNGLDLCLEDYLQKNITRAILEKRIEMIFKKEFANKEELESLRENMKVNLRSRKVYINDVNIVLTLKEYEILVYFLNKRNTVITREELLSALWKKPVELLDPKTVNTHIKKIRAKLKITALMSVRGVGYEWVEH